MLQRAKNTSSLFKSKLFSHVDDQSELVKTLRQIMNSLRDSEVYNDKSPRSTKAKVVVPVDSFRPGIKQIKQDSSF